MSQRYHTGMLSKKGCRHVHTVIPDGHGYHIAECEYYSNARLIADALNAYTKNQQENQNEPHCR